MHNKMNVLFYGPLGTRKKYVVGAGETGNLRTIHLLNKNNYSVITLKKPYPVKTIPGYAVYMLKMMLKIFNLIFLLMTHQILTVHVSGFYLHLVYHEYFMVLISKLFKKKCIYELRGGGVQEAFQQRSNIY